jgi:Zn-dependent protease with chaperone function
MSYPAVLHDPESGTTRRVTVAWNSGLHGAFLVEDSAGTSREIAATDLSLTQGGWRGDAVNFSWQHEGRTWAVTLDDPQAVAQLAKELPPPFSAQIAAWQKQSKRGERWSATILTVAGLVTLLPLFLLLALFMMRDRILDAVIAKMPTSIDKQIGELMHQQLVASGGLVKEGPAVEAVRVVSQRFLPHLPKQDFTFRFEVVNDKSVNAFAAPGGLVVVHTGLLAKATSVDQLVGVLGHEITHVTRRHSLRQIVYDLGLTTTLRWLLGVPDGVADTIAGAAANLSGLKFSREQESEADRGGVELLQKARLPAGGLQSFLDMLAQERGNVPSFLSTHPADKERSATLRRLIEERGQWEIEPLMIDWEAVRRDAEARMQKR